MDNFTPVSATLGGLLIGLAAVMLMAFNGRIAGISGLFSGMVFGAPGDRLWRVFFVVGLIAAPLITFAIRGEMPPFEITSNWTLSIAGGVLVGFGTRLGSGCTSGHGVCGMSRLSARSIVAVLIFMGTGMATVAIARAVVGG